MYRANPFTYLVSSLLSTTLGAAPVRCADDELQRFAPPSNQTCGEYLTNYISRNGGYLLSQEATDSCEYCRMSNTNDFLAGLTIEYGNRWRDWGILCVFVVFNVGAAVFLYWLVRVPKQGKRGGKKG